MAENSSFSYDQVALESERLCNLLDCKKDELAMCTPGSWRHREIQVEIAEIRKQLNGI